VAGFCEYGDVPAGSGATELVSYKQIELHFALGEKNKPYV
jgi:hypothetical protein